MMRRVFCFVLFVVFFIESPAQTLHTLLFVNEEESNRERDRSEDMKQMYRFFEYIAESIGYTYSPFKCSGRDFTARKVDEKIDRLKVEDMDVVVFYYSGHGYNEGENIWPTLSLKDKQYSHAAIMKRLKNVCASKPKLILCIADCCNKGMTNDIDVASIYGSSDVIPIKTLFLGFNGRKSIMMSASKQGQISWSSLKYGAYFGISLRKAIMGVKTSEATWENVLEKASSFMRKYTNGQQTPQFDISLSSDPFE